MVNEDYRYHVQGYPEKVLWFWPRSRCGDIEDGVALQHGREGGWIVDFKDLEDMYIRALLARHGRPHRQDIEVRIATEVQA